MFTPPRCPHRDCTRHLDPTPEFFVRRGYYYPKCRPHGVPRFRCRTCRRSFSRQTFRVDRYDHKPHLNEWVLKLLCSGIGLRQTARLIGMTARNTEMKFRKLGRHARRLNCNLRSDLPADATLQLDELESYEGRRSTRPLTLPMLIDRGSRLIIAARSAPIRPSGPMPEKRKRAIAEDEQRYGRRRSLSRAAVYLVLVVGKRLCRHWKTVRLQTDEKKSYPKLAKRAFGAERLEHSRTPSTLARGTYNPLFPINHTEAMARDLNGRLRRQSWLVSKKFRFLDLQLHLYAAYRNFIRPRFNGEQESPAMLVGWLPQCLSANQVLSWRQDWGGLSGHPLSRHAEPMSDLLPQAAGA